MATPIQVNSNHDYKGNKPTNAGQASQSGELMEFAQTNVLLDNKQDNITGGNGIAVNGNEVSVDLSSSAADYSLLTLSNASTPNGDLSGSFNKLSYPAYVLYKSGTDGSYDLKYDTGGFSAFARDNGNGTFDVVFAQDTDGTPNSNNQWAAFRTVTNPFTATGDITDFILNSNSGVGGLRYDVTSSHDTDEFSRKIPVESDDDVSYGAGSSDSFLEYENGKLKVSVVQSKDNGSTTNILSGHASATAIDEAEARASVAGNNSFSNATTSFIGTVTNVQSAIEAGKVILDTNTSAISGIQSINDSQNNKISAHSTVIGVGDSDTNMGNWAGSGAIFLASATTAKEGIEAAAAGVTISLSTLGTVLGLSQGDTDFGDGFTILPNDEDAKALFQAIESELQSLAAGAGATWSAGVVQSVHTSNIADLNNPATDVFGGETLTQGQVFLASGQSAQSENGFYVFDTTSTALARWSEADESSEFIQNRSVQIVSDGTEWSYYGIADPTVGTNVLPFKKVRDSIIADQSISEPKLTTALADKINAKSDKYREECTLVADVAYEVNHNLGEKYPVISVFGNTDRLEEYDVQAIDSTKFTITSSTNEVVNVTAIG